MQLVTAPLGDKIILDGVTRRSILQLVRERLSDNKGALEPVEIVERHYQMEELVEAVEEGRLIEAFAAGTAVRIHNLFPNISLLTQLQFFVSPVAAIGYKGSDLKVPMARSDSGEYAALIKSWLVDIMYGKEAHEWGVVVKEIEQ